MKYLKENNKTMFTYLDFLKKKDKVQIDGNESEPTINTTDGLAEIHPNVEHFEIGNTDISDVSGLNQMKKLKVLMIYENPKIISVNGLDSLELSNLSLYKLESLSNLNIKVSATKVVFGDCPNFKPTLNGITGVEELDINNCSAVKDLMFLKDNSETLRKINISNTNIETLYGMQHLPNVQFDFRENNNNKNDIFLFHKLFYESLKGKPIKDYWKEIVQYWINAIEKGKTTILGLSHEDIKETFIDGIKLPIEEMERLFSGEELRYIKSVAGVNKFNL